MKKQAATSIILWIVGIASAVLLLYTLNPPGDDGRAPATAPTFAGRASAEWHGKAAVDDPADDALGGDSVLEMPAVTIVGPRRGVAEMQGSTVVASPDAARSPRCAVGAVATIP